MALQHDAIPAEVRERPQWVIWQCEERDGKPTKVPYQAANPSQKASSTNPATWGTFDQAVAAADQADGIGYVFSDDDPFVGIDLDKLTTPGMGIDLDKLTPAIRGAVELLDSYTEESVSGTGLHVIVQGRLNGAAGRRHKNVEVYGAGRYFCMTGRRIAGLPVTIENRQTELEQVIEEFLPPKIVQGSPKPSKPVSLTDRDLLEKMFAAANGAKVRRLWDGDWSGYPSHSDADAALCSILAFWTARDAARMDALFRQSGLMREKWKRLDYRERTIDFTIGQTGEVYEEPGARLEATGEIRQLIHTVGADARSTTLAAMVAVFRRWLHLPDLGCLYAILGTVAANLMPGDPVWLLAVGPPGSGKTEQLQPLSVLSCVHQAATLTEASLLSGTPKREKASDASGGLLRDIGPFGIILAKDFGSVLSMHRDARSRLLAALREVYDGSWTRHLGTDGGRTLHWEGKVGLVAGVTPAIDSHHAVMGAMGERFTFYRLPRVDDDAQARQALAHAGHENAMRSELAQAVAGLFAGIVLPEQPPSLTEPETVRLIALAGLAVRCRSSVERDSYSREIQLIPEPEAPGRLALVLSRLLAGMVAVGVPRAEAWWIVAKVALDSMPALRRTMVEFLHLLKDPTDTGTLAREAGYPTQTARRALEDLAAHGVVFRDGRGQGNADLWQLSDWTLKRWSSTVPEMSGDTNAAP